jgi:hypothetical protein
MLGGGGGGAGGYRAGTGLSVSAGTTYSITVGGWWFSKELTDQIQFLALLLLLVAVRRFTNPNTNGAMEVLVAVLVAFGGTTAGYWKYTICKPSQGNNGGAFLNTALMAVQVVGVEHLLLVQMGIYSTGGAGGAGSSFYHIWGFSYIRWRGWWRGLQCRLLDWWCGGSGIGGAGGAIPMLLERLVLLTQEVVEVVEVEILAAQERQAAQAAQVS